MKLTAFAISVIALVSCLPQQSSAADEPANSTTVPENQLSNVTRDVQQWHDLQHSSCKFVKVVSTAIEEQNQNSATELWTIKACDAKQFVYRVLVMPGEGGLTDSVSNADGSAMHME